jgi:hypothetical protein
MALSSAPRRWASTRMRSSGCPTPMQTRRAALRFHVHPESFPRPRPVPSPSSVPAWRAWPVHSFWPGPGTACTSSTKAGGLGPDEHAARHRRRRPLAVRPWCTLFQAHDADFRAQVRSWQEAGATAPWPGRIGLHDGERLRLQDNAPQRFVGTPRMTSPAAHMVRGMQARSGALSMADHR